jgi:hypothetical protein
LPATRFMCSELFQYAPPFTHVNVLSVVPLRVKPPPLAVESVGLATLPNSIFLSSILIVVELIVVVTPLTVKLPSIITLPGVATVPTCSVAVGAELKSPI